MKMDEHDCSLERVRDETSSSLSMAEFDEEKYLPYLDDIDLDAAQKQAFLAILWNIMRSCIEMNVPPKIWGQMIDRLTDLPSGESAEIN